MNLNFQIISDFNFNIIYYLIIHKWPIKEYRIHFMDCIQMISLSILRFIFFFYCIVYSHLTFKLSKISALLLNKISIIIFWINCCRLLLWVRFMFKRLPTPLNYAKHLKLVALAAHALSNALFVLVLKFCASKQIVVLKMKGVLYLVLN